MTKRMLRFVANDREVGTEAWEGSPALDFIRRELGLTGTKEGCREGDCGACAVILGERLENGAVRYRAAPSCLLALGELDGRHLVTIEGLASGAEDGLTPVMLAFLAENASQCGFCSPGFIVSLTAWLLEGERLDEAGALTAVEGNLCRCTGYGSIRRAASRLLAEFPGLPADPLARIDALVAARVVPASLAAFARGKLLADDARVRPAAGETSLVIGGGTDFYVRNTDPEPRDGFFLAGSDPALRRMTRSGDGGLEVGAAVTIRDFFACPELLSLVPGIGRFEASFASILVRNRATLGGNIANASPVADMTSMLIALGARLGIARPGGDGPSREIPLESFFLGYKKLDLGPGEIIRTILIPPPCRPFRFNFEKAAKRASLDIAAVNTAVLLELDGNRVVRGRLSAGGVAATPLLLPKSSAFLAGRAVSAGTARDLAALAASEVETIGDVRGSAGYRRRVLERLVMAHFTTLFRDRVADGIAEDLAVRVSSSEEDRR
ncbi:MAG: FAD binding domain-containing protein [Spirochaetes bacterium]|nr:FAD binding domain-containing protein [Spirochaetota bacterium]